MGWDRCMTDNSKLRLVRPLLNFDREETAEVCRMTGTPVSRWEQCIAALVQLHCHTPGLQEHSHAVLALLDEHLAVAACLLDTFGASPVIAPSFSCSTTEGA